jgi:hypothetical protein
MKEGNGSQTEYAVFAGHSAGDMEEALSAHEVGLEARPERVAPPADSWRVEAGAAQQRIVENSAEGRAQGQLVGDAAADDGEDLGHGDAVLGEEAVSSAPVLELRAGSGKQASHGVTSEAEQRTQGEGLRAVADALLVEGGEAVFPELLELREDTGGVFFRTGAGASRRRSARRALSSTIHSTVSPLANSMA